MRRPWISIRLTLGPGEPGLHSDGTGAPAEAEGLFRRVLSAEPRRIDARMDLAECLIRTGDLEGARTNLEKILKQEPGIHKLSTSCITYIARGVTWRP